MDADGLLSMHQRLHRYQARFVENAALYRERTEAWRVAGQRVGIVELQRYIMYAQQDAARYLHSARLWREPMQPGHQAANEAARGGMLEPAGPSVGDRGLGVERM